MERPPSRLEEGRLFDHGIRILTGQADLSIAPSL
jgi:hypothetical protein